MLDNISVIDHYSPGCCAQVSERRRSQQTGGVQAQKVTNVVLCVLLQI